MLAFVVWLAAGAAVGWFAMRLVEDKELAERRLESVLDASSEAILRVDAGGAITAASPGARALDGEVVGRPLADVVADADRILAAVRSGERLTGGAVSVIPTAERLEAIVVVRDVDELQRVKSELRNAEAKYRSLTEHLPLVTYVRSVDGEGETTFVSPQIDKLVGYTADEWLADTGLLLRLVHPDDRGRVAADRDNVDPLKGLQTSYRLVARDGRTVWVREEAVVVLDESGRPLCIQGYLLDISQRKAAEQERKELRAAEAATAGEVRDRQRKVEFVAEAASVLASSLEVQATVGQVAALTVRDLAEWCVVDVLGEEGTVTRYAAERAERSGVSAEPQAQPEPAVHDVIRERRPELSESVMRLPLLARDGRAVGALTLIAGEDHPRYDADDLPWARALAGMIALAIDNSRLQADVERRRNAMRVLRHVDEGVFLVDQAGLIRLWNPAAAAITGVSAEAAEGKPIADAVDGWVEIADLVPVGSAREPARPAALPLETERGERWISISGVEFAAGTVYAFRDITEGHRLDELKTEFIATASHELRTPLAAVYGAAQTLKRHDFALDESGRERFIDLIVEESDRLARIVNQILLANQLEVGRLDLEVEPFDAADLVERVVESAKTHAPSHIEFDVQVAADVPPVAADKDKVRQILVNLVENAVKYSPGGGRIEVGVEPQDAAVRFRVVDEGMGIPEDEQPRIFEKFYRLDPNMTRGIGGTGLGLYICGELVERMGGEIWVESEQGKGSAFFVKLPSSGGRAPSAARELAEWERSGPAVPRR